MQHQTVAAQADSGLFDLARGFLVDIGGPRARLDTMPGVMMDRPSAVLSLADIIADDAGACVLGANGPNLSIVLETDQAVLAEGSADAYATAAGADVSGHSFIAFASGITLYFPAELEVAVAAPVGSAFGEPSQHVPAVQKRLMS